MSITIQLNPDFYPHLTSDEVPEEWRLLISIAALGLASCPWVVDIESLCDITNIPIDMINQYFDHWSSMGLLIVTENPGGSMLEQSVRLSALDQLAREKSAAHDFLAELVPTDHPNAFPQRFPEVFPPDPPTSPDQPTLLDVCPTIDSDEDGHHVSMGQG